MPEIQSFEFEDEIFIQISGARVFLVRFTCTVCTQSRPESRRNFKFVDLCAKRML